MEFFGSTKLYEVAQDVNFTCLDIGARHNFIADLLPLAPHVNAIGFDADKEECARLNSVNESEKGPWKSLRFIPTGVANSTGERDFYLYKQRGCSSLLEAIDGFGTEYSRGDYYQLDKEVTIDTMPLADAAEKFDFKDASYMKIDVEGIELEIFETSDELLNNSLLAIRAEISYVLSHHGQPYNCDIESFLRKYDFAPFSFLEQHSWRCFTRKKSVLDEECKFPYSNAQLVHGDLLFFKDYKKMPLETEADILQHIRLGAYALVYGFIDHASIVLNQKEVSQFLKSKWNIDSIDDEILTVSKHFAAEYRYKQKRAFLSECKKRLKGLLGLK